MGRHISRTMKVRWRLFIPGFRSLISTGVLLDVVIFIVFSENLENYLERQKFIVYWLSSFILSAGILVSGWEKLYCFWSDRKKPAWTQFESLLSSSSPSQFWSSRKSCLHFSLKIFKCHCAISSSYCLVATIPGIIDVGDGHFNLVFTMKIAHYVGSVCSGKCGGHGVRLDDNISQLD